MASSRTFFARLVYGRSSPTAPGGPGLRRADSISQIAGVKMEICKDLAGNLVINPENAQQLMLGPYVWVMKPVGFLPRGLQDPSNSIGKVVAADHFRRLDTRTSPPSNALRFCCRGVRRSRASPSRIYSRGCARHTPPSAASACYTAPAAVPERSAQDEPVR